MSSSGHIDGLLTAVEVVWTPLGEIAKIKHGKDWKGLAAGSTPVYGSGGIMGYVDRHSYNKPTVLIPRKGSITNIFYVDSPFWNVDTVFYTEIDDSRVVPKYLFYFFETLDLMSMDTGSGRPSLTQSILNKVLVPLPLESDESKSLEIQREIVRVLDTFSELTSELTAKLTSELINRKAQYAYFRDRLLSFEETEVEWVPLGEVGEFIRGKRFTKDDYAEDGIDAIHYGDIYTRYGTWTDRALTRLRSDMAKALRYAEPGDLVLAGVGETVEDVGKAVAWLGTGKVAIHDDSYAFRHAMNPKYLSYAMQTSAFIEAKAKHVSRGKLNRLSATGLAKVRVPIPLPSDPGKSLEEQVRIVDILDKFDKVIYSISDGLPREIELRRKQYEYYRNLLLSFPRPCEAQA